MASSHSGSAPTIRRRRRVEASILLSPGVAFLAVFLILPITLIFATSFLKRGMYGGIVFEFTLDNFARLLEPSYLQVISNSLGIAAIVTFGALLIAYPAVIAISSLSPRWKILAIVGMIVPFWTSFLIRTYAWVLLLGDQGWVNGFLQVISVIDDPIRMLYSPGALTVTLLNVYLPLMVLPLWVAYERVGQDLREAASILGSSRWRIFRTVDFPLSLPGALTGAAFVFVPAMSNFVVADLVGGGKTVMVGNLIQDQFLTARDWPFGAALALVLTVLLVAILLVQSIVSRRISGGKA